MASRLMTPAAQHKGRKVLVVDDEESMRELLRLHLGNNGYEVISAEDAVVAGRLVVEQRPDLMIVDVEMPYMNGYEFVAAVKADPATRDIPIVFLTTDANVAEQTVKLRADAYLNKPVMANRLLEVVALLTL
jgi:chemosensory pili system protein ChpA (sensor histidine kinase/response regulator)